MAVYIVSVAVGYEGFHPVWAGTDRTEALRHADAIRGGGDHRENPNDHEYVRVAEWEGETEKVLGQWTWSFHDPAKRFLWFVSAYPDRED